MLKMGKKTYFQNPHLDGSSKLLDGDKNIGFLLIHGFTATTIEVMGLARYVNERGYPVCAPLLPGHGSSPEDLNSKKFFEWIECVESAYRNISVLVDHVVIGGESMDAVLSLYLAQQHPEINALLLYSPALIVPKLRYARWLRFFMNKIDKGDRSDESTWQGYTVWPLKAAVELIKLQKAVINQLPEISIPTAIFHGQFDKTIHPQVSNFIYDQIKSESKIIFPMHQSAHVMLLGQEFDQIAGKTMNFLQANHIL